MRVTFNRVFSAAHRLHNDPSKCSNIHGHNYKVEVGIEGDLPISESMMVPFDKVKQVIDHFDHALILSITDPLIDLLAHDVRIVTMADAPTTENLAHELAREIADISRSTSSRVVTVWLAETGNIMACATVATPPNYETKDPVEAVDQDTAEVPNL